MRARRRGRARQRRQEGGVPSRARAAALRGRPRRAPADRAIDAAAERRIVEPRRRRHPCLAALRLAAPVRRLLLLLCCSSCCSLPGQAARARLPEGLPLGHGDRRLPDGGRRSALERRPRAATGGSGATTARTSPRVTSAATASSAAGPLAPVPPGRAAGPRPARLERVPALDRVEPRCSRAPPAARTARARSTAASTGRRPATTRPSCASSGGLGMRPMVTLNHFTLPRWLHDPIAVRRAFAGVGPDDPVPAVAARRLARPAHRARVRRVRGLGRVALRPPRRPLGDGQRADGGGGQRLRERPRRVRGLVPARRLLVPRRGPRGAQPRRRQRARLRRRPPPGPQGASGAGPEHDRLHARRPGQRGGSPRRASTRTTSSTASSSTRRSGARSTRTSTAGSSRASAGATCAGGPTSSASTTTSAAA